MNSEEEGVGQGHGMTNAKKGLGIFKEGLVFQSSQRAGRVMDMRGRRTGPCITPTYRMFPYHEE